MAIANSMIYLPEDIILLIFARLSVKSLVRFKCISKSWRALIRSPILIDKHLSLSHDRAPQQIIMKFENKLRNKSILSFHSIDEFLKLTAPDLEVSGLSSNLRHHDIFVDFIGSCNGIVCITHGISRIIIICNPALREFRTLPPSPFRRTRENRGGKFVRVSAGYGFGFDQVSNDYKVVCISSFRPKEWDWNQEWPHTVGSYSRAEVYNLKTDSWRKANSILPQQFLLSSSAFGILVNGYFHWIARSRAAHEFILSFHVSTEEFRTIPRPRSDIHGLPDCFSCRKTLAALHESLACIAWTSQGNIEVWIMNRYGFEKSWTRQYFTQPPIGYLGNKLFVQRDNTLLVERNDGRLVSFSFHTDQNQQLWPYDIHVCPISLTERSLNRPIYEELRCAIYKESLVSITRD